MSRGKLWRFTVQSACSSFPLDMLRYDACWPADDMAVVDISMLTLGRPSNGAGARITLMSHQEPTEARWLSFGWSVLERRRI